jgi:hypothetical protein
MGVENTRKSEDARNLPISIRSIETGQREQIKEKIEQLKACYRVATPDEVMEKMNIKDLGMSNELIPIAVDIMNYTISFVLEKTEANPAYSELARQFLDAESPEEKLEREARLADELRNDLETPEKANELGAELYDHLGSKKNIAAKAMVQNPESFAELINKTVLLAVNHIIIPKAIWKTLDDFQRKADEKKEEKA